MKDMKDLPWHADTWAGNVRIVICTYASFQYTKLAISPSPNECTIIPSNYQVIACVRHSIAKDM